MEYRLPFQSSKKSKKKVGLEYFPGKKCNKCAAKEDILGLNIYVKKKQQHVILWRLKESWDTPDFSNGSLCMQGGRLGPQLVQAGSPAQHSPVAQRKRFMLLPLQYSFSGSKLNIDSFLQDGL